MTLDVVALGIFKQQLRSEPGRSADRASAARPVLTGVLATIFTFAWSQIESNVVTPRLMGRAVEMNPLGVLVALLVGNELLGLLGALFAIPAAAAIAVIVDEFRQQRLKYLAEATDGAA